MRKIIIAIDGYSGTGKSSTAKLVAKALEYSYIDTGAMYRAVTLHFIRKNVQIIDANAVEAALAQCKINFSKDGIFLNDKPVDAELRTMKVNELVSPVSALSAVRKKLVDMQRNMGKQKEIVMDGRDIGTVVFPNADLKIFMEADASVRAERRKKQLEEKGIYESKEEIMQNLLSRDAADTSRADSPLRRASEAILLDSGSMSLDEQVDKIVMLAKDKMYES